MKAELTLEDYIAKAIGSVILSLPIAGLGTFLWQVYNWLKTGEWVSISVIDFLLWTGLDANWLHQPQSWIGVWKIFDWMPLSLGCVVLSVSLLLTVILYLIIFE